MQKIEFLDFMVTPTGISMDMAKTDAVSVWPTLTNLKAVQAFLGFANFYRRCIVRFSDIVIPLIRLTRKDIPFTWGPNHTEAFETLKTAFTQAPILAHFNPDNPIVVETDACDYTIAAIISQISPDDGDIHPITFYSRSMQPVGSNTRSTTKSYSRYSRPSNNGATTSRALHTSYSCSRITRTSNTLRPPSSSRVAKSVGRSTSLDSTT